MKTVSLQIGNGDDKLSQSDWHNFVVATQKLVESRCAKLHFFGAPENWCRQQNVAFIFDLSEDSIEELKAEIRALRKQYQQESAAWTEGKTIFI